MRQVDVGDAAWVGRVDFLYEELRLVLEVNGACTPVYPRSSETSTARRSSWPLGYTVLPIPEHLIQSAPDEVLRLVREARRRAAA